jgi:HEAT repeat protein
LPTWGNADQAVPPLIEALGDSDQGVVDGAIQALGKLKDLRAVGPICEKATRYGFQVHEALRSIGPAAEGEVLQYLNHSDENVRRTAVLALADIGTAQCLPLLVQVSHRGDSTRGEAERALQMVRERISKNGT